MITLNGLDANKAKEALARAEKDKLVVVARLIIESGAYFDVWSGNFFYSVIFAKENGKVIAACNHAHLNVLPEVEGQLCKHVAIAAKEYVAILRAEQAERK
jgi:hypothetical protein